MRCLLGGLRTLSRFWGAGWSLFDLADLIVVYSGFRVSSFRALRFI